MKKSIGITLFATLAVLGNVWGAVPESGALPRTASGEASLTVALPGDAADLVAPVDGSGTLDPAAISGQPSLPDGASISGGLPELGSASSTHRDDDGHEADEETDEDGMTLELASQAGRVVPSPELNPLPDHEFDDETEIDDPNSPSAEGHSSDKGTDGQEDKPAQKKATLLRLLMGGVGFVGGYVGGECVETWQKGLVLLGITFVPAVAQKVIGTDLPLTDVTKGAALGILVAAASRAKSGTLPTIPKLPSCKTVASLSGQMGLLVKRS